MTRPSFCKLDPCRYAACDCESSSEQKAAGEFLRRKALESERANGHKEKHSEGTPRTDALLRGINEGRRPHQQYVVPAEIEELARQLERELAAANAEIETMQLEIIKLRGSYAAFAASATPEISDNDRRWRFLEHGCQWVSWTPINGQTVSFDPRNLTGYSGDLNDMRGQADIELRKHLEILRAGLAAADNTTAREGKDG